MHLLNTDGRTLSFANDFEPKCSCLPNDTNQTKIFLQNSRTQKTKLTIAITRTNERVCSVRQYIPGKSCLKRALGFLRGGANHFFLFFDFQTLKRHSSTTIQSISKKKIVVIIGGLRWPEKNNLADSAISGQNITSIAKNRQFWALSKCPPPSNFCGKIFLIK